MIFEEWKQMKPADILHILDIWHLSIAIGTPLKGTLNTHILNTPEQFLKGYYIFKLLCVRGVWRHENNFQSQFSPCTVWVPVIKLRL